MSDFDYGKTLPDGQYERHPGLPNAKAAKKVKPVRLEYKHTKCGVVTRMPQHCAETYAVNPSFYSSTFCCDCNSYHPVSEFTWLDDGSLVGS